MGVSKPMRHALQLGTAWWMTIAAVATVIVLRTDHRSALERTPTPAAPPVARGALSLPLSDHVVLMGPETIDLDGKTLYSIYGAEPQDSPMFKLPDLYEGLAALPPPHDVLLIIRRGPWLEYEMQAQAVVKNSAIAAGYLPLVIPDPHAIELDLDGDVLRCNGVAIDAAHLISHLDSRRATSTQQVPLVFLHAERDDPRVTAYRIAIRMAGYVPVVMAARPWAYTDRPQHVLTVDDDAVLFDGESTKSYTMGCVTLGQRACEAMPDALPGSKGALAVIPLGDVDRRRPDLMAQVDHEARLGGYVPRVVHPANLPQLVVTDDGLSSDPERITTPFVELHVATKRAEPLIRALDAIDAAHALAVITYEPGVTPRDGHHAYIDQDCATVRYMDDEMTFAELGKRLASERANIPEMTLYADIHDRSWDAMQRAELARVVRSAGYLPRLTRDSPQPTALPRSRCDPNR